VYYELWSDHYGSSAITNRDTYWIFNRSMHDGPFWTTFWVDWRGHNTTTTTSNIMN